VCVCVCVCVVVGSNADACQRFSSVVPMSIAKRQA
jgi:hypothetical protein